MSLSERSWKNCRRLVVKIGSSLFFDGGKKLDSKLLDDLCGQIAQITRSGREVIIVSSGAIALGMGVLRLSERPKELAYLQASAAIGQNELMDLYRDTFRRKRLHCGQVLLTWDDFSDRQRYLNAQNTIKTLLKLGVVPVINENDTVSTDEIKFGDNDQLSALVASAVGADALVILSDVAGLFGSDKKTVIRRVERITDDIVGLAAPTKRQTSVGGMITKIKAARITVESGIPCVIAHGRAKRVLISLSQDLASTGTVFLPKDGGLTQRDRWMAFSSKPKGRIIVDDGAKSALQNKKSLLSVGVVGVVGDFRSGDVVGIVDAKGVEFARGIASVPSGLLCGLCGKHSDKEAVHCDNIVIV